MLKECIEDLEQCKTLRRQPLFEYALRRLKQVLDRESDDDEKPAVEDTD